MYKVVDFDVEHASLIGAGQNPDETCHSREWVHAHGESDALSKSEARLRCRIADMHISRERQW